MADGSDRHEIANLWWVDWSLNPFCRSFITASDDHEYLTERIWEEARQASVRSFSTFPLYRLTPIN